MTDSRVYLSTIARSFLFATLSFAAMTLPSVAQDSSASSAANPATVDDLKKEVQSSLDHLNRMQQELDAHQESENLQQQINAERKHLEAIEEQLDQAGSSSSKPVQAGVSPSTSKLTPADIYNGGFYLESADKSFSLFANGLFQIRYTGFVPSSSVQALGESSQGTDTFDVYLARLALSGSVFQPNLKYFLQFQGSTAGNSGNVSVLDWFTSDTISKALTIQVGRSVAPYTYEYYDNPCDYLFPDLSTAEYAFLMQRAIGVQTFGQAGKSSWAFMAANSIPALDGGNQENFNSKLAYVGHYQLDVLAPYGYIESDPAGAAKPELTLWAAAGYNPINYNSGFENVTAGDSTANATATIGFRYKYFTLQPSGYYRKTNPASGAASNNSWGYGEQAGQYLVPHKLEVAERISGVNWGAPDYAAGAPVPAPGALPVENSWFAGPGFSYHRVGEDSAGLNYYLHGHNAKVQMEYSYLHGNTFADRSFSANRVWIQTQITF